MRFLQKASVSVASLMLLAAPMAADAAPQTFVIDGSHTAVTWHIDHFGYSTPSGKFMNFDGEVVLDQENPENSSVSVTIPLDTVNSGVPKLDEHLKNEDFFHVEKYPNATYVSDKVEVTGEKTAKVHGTLTMHGVSKPVVLDVTLNKIDENMFKKQTAGFSATTTIKRSDFGITKYLPGLGDEIKIEIESEANLKGEE